METSIVMPKVNNDRLFLEKCEFLQPEFYSSKEPVKPMDLTRITRISSLSRLQGPVPAPSRTKDIKQAEFRAFPTVALISPFIHCQ